MPRPTKGERIPGSGRKKGYKETKTLDKEAARELVRKLVTAELLPIVEAQITAAKGLRHTYMRDKKGRYVHLTDPADIATALNSGNEGSYYWTFTKDPSTQAAADLLNRALDKPKEQLQEIKVIGDDEMVRRLHAGRARAAAKKE